MSSERNWGGGKTPFFLWKKTKALLTKKPGEKIIYYKIPFINFFQGLLLFKPGSHNGIAQAWKACALTGVRVRLSSQALSLFFYGKKTLGKAPFCCLAKTRGKKENKEHSD